MRSAQSTGGPSVGGGGLRLLNKPLCERPPRRGPLNSKCDHSFHYDYQNAEPQGHWMDTALRNPLVHGDE